MRLEQYPNYWIDRAEKSGAIHGQSQHWNKDARNRERTSFENGRGVCCVFESFS